MYDRASVYLDFAIDSIAAGLNDSSTAYESFREADCSVIFLEKLLKKDYDIWIKFEAYGLFDKSITALSENSPTDLEPIRGALRKLEVAKSFLRN
jgi:hypothetical protein